MLQDDSFIKWALRVKIGSIPFICFTATNYRRILMLVTMQLLYVAINSSSGKKEAFINKFPFLNF